jgi:hypothetical protein
MLKKPTLYEKNIKDSLKVVNPLLFSDDIKYIENLSQEIKKGYDSFRNHV